MKTYCNAGSVVLALLGFALSSAEADSYLMRGVTVDVWDGEHFEYLLSTPNDAPTYKDQIGFGTVTATPRIDLLNQVRVYGQYDPDLFKVVSLPGFPQTNSIKLTLQDAGQISKNEWLAVPFGTSGFFTWQVNTNATPTLLSKFDFSYLQATTTEMYGLEQVPEPSAAALLGGGLVAYALGRRRKTSAGSTSAA